MKPVVIICPGNGCSNIRVSNWYGELYRKLTEKGIPCICEDFPDPLHARRDRWIPFIRSLVENHHQNQNNSDGKDNVILVGHSSGAQATLRYAELYPLHGAVLVSATYSDLGDAHERASGYYPQLAKPKGKGDDNDGVKYPSLLEEESNPYRFEDMKRNCKTWHQFHSDDDPFIPVFEAKKIRDGLGLTDTFYLLPGRSHFFDYQPEFLNVILSLC